MVQHAATAAAFGVPQGTLAARLEDVASAAVEARLKPCRATRAS